MKSRLNKIYIIYSQEKKNFLKNKINIVKIEYFLYINKGSDIDDVF